MKPCGLLLASDCCAVFPLGLGLLSGSVWQVSGWLWWPCLF